ncbi:uncharacterized protein LOC143182351 [Calliopsis andreniformis]|uniref:uncharacterized protein LOC143182351 n=1 Tax=Calliopsis andreniformis TaxID=337506 RepID=UPI003FCDB266
MLNVACVRRSMSVPRLVSPDPCQRLWDFGGTPSLVSVQTMRCVIRNIHRGLSTSGQLDPSTPVTTDKHQMKTSHSDAAGVSGALLESTESSLGDEHSLCGFLYTMQLPNSEWG